MAVQQDPPSLNALQRNLDRNVPGCLWRWAQPLGPEFAGDFFPFLCCFLSPLGTLLSLFTNTCYYHNQKMKTNSAKILETPVGVEGQSHGSVVLDSLTWRAGGVPSPAVHPHVSAELHAHRARRRFQKRVVEGPCVSMCPACQAPRGCCRGREVPRQAQPPMWPVSSHSGLHGAGAMLTGELKKELTGGPAALDC